MKIEIVIALILGTALGLGGMFLVAQFMNQKPQIHSITTTSASPTPNTNSAQVKTALTSPRQFMSWDSSPLHVAGSVTGGNFAFLVGDTTDTVITIADNAFDTTTPPLQGVAGYRFFTAFGDKIGESVVVSFKDLPKEKKVTFGVVTDLTAESLQMRGSDGTIDQVAFTPNIIAATFIKETKKISPSEVAIGDRIAVVGEVAEKNVTIADGVFVIPSDFGIPTYVLKTGTITKLNKTEVTVSTKEGDLVLKTTADTKYFGLKDTGVLRKRTKLISSDTTRTAYVTFLSNSTNIRSIFISE